MLRKKYKQDSIWSKYKAPLLRNIDDIYIVSSVCQYKLLGACVHLANARNQMLLQSMSEDNIIPSSEVQSTSEQPSESEQPSVAKLPIEGEQPSEGEQSSEDKQPSEDKLTNEAKQPSEGELSTDPEGVEDESQEMSEEKLEALTAYLIKESNRKRKLKKLAESESMAQKAVQTEKMVKKMLRKIVAPLIGAVVGPAPEEGSTDPLPEGSTDPLPEGSTEPLPEEGENQEKEGKQTARQKAKEKRESKAASELGEDDKEPGLFMLPGFFDMNFNETMRYTNLIPLLAKKGCKITLEIAFLTEVVCLDRYQHFKFFDRSVDSNMGPLFDENGQPKENKDWQKLCKSPVVILEFLWAQSTNHPMFVAIPISEADETLNFYRYNAGKKRGESTPFSSVSIDQMIIAINKWICSLFDGDSPGYLGTYEFQNKLVTQLAKTYFPIHASNFLKEYPSGLAAKSGYYFCDHVSPLLRFVPYGPETILQAIHATDPSPLTVMPSDRQAILDVDSEGLYPEIELNSQSQPLPLAEIVRSTSIHYNDFILIGDNKEWLDKNLSELKQRWDNDDWLAFVYNICNHDLLTIFVFRTLCQRVIMAPSEGLNYQSGHWVHGLAGTGKSSWAVLLSLLVGPHLIAEMGMEMDSFANSALPGKHLLILSDIVKLSEKIYSALKPLLGRDFTRINVKYKRDIITMRLYCQFLFIGNKNPSEAGPLMQDAAMKDKTILTYLWKVLPSDFMGGDTTPYIQSIITEIWPWAILSNREWLNEQIRARKINNTRNSLVTYKKDIYEQYIEDNLIYSTVKATDVVPNQRTTTVDGANEPTVVDDSSLTVDDSKADKRPAKCPAFVSKNALREDIVSWIKKTMMEDKLAQAGGSLSNASFVLELPQLIADKVQERYGVVSFEKKRKNRSGYEGFELLPVFPEVKGKAPIPIVLKPTFKRFKKIVQPSELELLKSDLSFVLSGAFPFTPFEKNIYVVGGKLQYKIMQHFGAEPGFEKMKAGEMGLYDTQMDPLEVMQESHVPGVINSAFPAEYKMDRTVASSDETGSDEIALGITDDESLPAGEMDKVGELGSTSPVGKRSKFVGGIKTINGITVDPTKGQYVKKKKSEVDIERIAILSANPYIEFNPITETMTSEVVIDPGQNDPGKLTLPEFDQKIRGIFNSIREDQGLSLPDYEKATEKKSELLWKGPLNAEPLVFHKTEQKDSI